MKRIFLLGIIISVMAMQLNAQDSFKRKYVAGPTSAVSALKIDGNINVTLVVAPNEPSVYFDGSEHFTRNIKTSVIDGEMTIIAYTSSRSENDVVVIYAPDLSSLELIGDVKFKTIGTVNAENLRLTINGNCKLSIQHAGELDISLADNYELVEKKERRLNTN